MARLRTVQGHTLTLPPRRLSIGESAANDIPIAPGYGLAAVHFRLQPWESGHFLEDAGSGLGTLINGQPMSWAPLKHGDVITAGSIRMVYETDEGGPVPGFPAEGVPPAETVLTEEPERGEEEVPAAPPAIPPSWVPPEALGPPVPPWARPIPLILVPSRTRRFYLILFVVMAATAAAAWYLFAKS